LGVGREEAAKQGGQAHRGLRVEEVADRGAAPAGRTTRPSRRTLRWWEMVGWATSRFHDVGYEALVADPSARWSGGMAGWAWRCRAPRTAHDPVDRPPSPPRPGPPPPILPGRLRTRTGRGRPALRALPRMGVGGHLVVTQQPATRWTDRRRHRTVIHMLWIGAWPQQRRAASCGPFDGLTPSPGATAAAGGCRGPWTTAAGPEPFIDPPLSVGRDDSRSSECRAVATVIPEARRTGSPPRRGAAGHIPGP